MNRIRKIRPDVEASTSGVWDLHDWEQICEVTSAVAAAAPSERAAWKIIRRQSRRVLRTYSTSFFIVTRFLPAGKREQVEAIYAAVRYPDEIVDTFPIDTDAQLSLLNKWERAYEVAIDTPSIRERLEKGVPAFVAAFSQVVRDCRIPPQHYRDFLAAMRLDAQPRRFSSLDDLIEGYVYGSAIVVGYFLAHVYGSATPNDWERALSASRSLGIALQLTNFLRDVAEDQRRGRVYLPTEMLEAMGIYDLDVEDGRQRDAIRRVLMQMRDVAEQFYSVAARDVDAFAPDSRMAIRACINVYGRLNKRIAADPDRPLIRQTVPMHEKFRALPPSKYWRLPLAYLAGT